MVPEEDPAAVRQTGEDIAVLHLSSPDVFCKNVIFCPEYHQQRIRYRMKEKERKFCDTEELARISHDIRTLTNAIMGFTKRAREYIGDRDKALECIEKLDAVGSHLLSLSNELFELSGIGSGSSSLITQNTDLRRLLQDIYDVAQAGAAGKNLGIHMDLSGVEHNWVQTDPSQLYQVLLNLTDNAVKFTNPGGQVTILASEFSEKSEKCSVYQFVVRDTGIGIGPDFLPYLFEPLTREYRTLHSKGTGFGMVIVKKCVAQLNGDIQAESEPGRGTQFTIRIPLRWDDTLPTVEKQSCLPAGDSVKTEALWGKTILLVEDNEVNRKLVRGMLEAVKIQVEEAENGEEGLRILKSAPEDYFDLILMDVRMPLMDGYAAAQKIRELGSRRLSRIPIIALTANVLAQDRRKALESGMDGYIVKPFKAEVLWDTLIRCLGGEV